MKILEQLQNMGTELHFHFYGQVEYFDLSRTVPIVRQKDLGEQSVNVFSDFLTNLLPSGRATTPFSGVGCNELS